MNFQSRFQAERLARRNRSALPGDTNVARLGAAGYYADIVIYPFVIAALLIAELVRVEGIPYRWLAACVVGLAAWTLIEYIIHRFIFHVIPPALQLHLDHHDAPRAKIGTPIWLSFAAFVLGAFLPLWRYGDFDLASGGVAGLLIGYCWYIVVHHAVHHWRIEPSSWLYAAKLRHTMHHYRTDDCNFGVTTGLWDRVFGTAEAARPLRPEPHG